ncbi:MAG: hypothetical protein A4E19_17840 [Nitrospira sp. SG-bin1]|nr:MAG: hypothetical protein A4E19_17840 [Nitrospira sp. SG-bin1]
MTCAWPGGYNLVPETVAMRSAGHTARSVFDRYNITSEDNLREATKRLNRYMQEKKITLESEASADTDRQTH